MINPILAALVAWDGTNITWDTNTLTTPILVAVTTAVGGAVVLFLIYKGISLMFGYVKGEGVLSRAGTDSMDQAAWARYDEVICETGSETQARAAFDESINSGVGASGDNGYSLYLANGGQGSREQYEVEVAEWAAEPDPGAEPKFEP